MEVTGEENGPMAAFNLCCSSDLSLAYAALHYHRDTLTGSRAGAGRGASYFCHHSMKFVKEDYYGYCVEKSVRS
jgi:hypothetical protein